ncbi:hypothetical protein HPB52_017642 [Rhipicephalus sanguineus]|uniref:Uncharacterized protein n=1 Tax=Rhipicephalus sanguineus TaxID=34632 RepID=A0A9D4PL20_RHISA|nr:hypothetical protein HPB52_017642 [Rhipicephalus sanguineus]
MHRERFFALGRELGLEKDALREWVDKECALARDERAREREEAKESAERQRLLQEQELKILELKLKLQESAGRQSAEANEPGGATSSVTTSTTRLRDLSIAEQFMESCLPALRVFLKERNCRTLQEIALTSDNFMDAQSLINLGKERACRETDSLYDVVLGNIKGAVPLDNKRVMETRTINPNSSADIDEKTPKTHTNRRSRRQDQVTLSTSPWPNSRPDSTRYRSTLTSQDDTWLPLDTTPRVPQRRRPRQRSYFEERNTDRLNQSRPGYLTLRRDGTDSLSAQMHESPSSPQPPLQPLQDQVKT